MTGLIPFRCMHNVVVPERIVWVTFWDVRAAADNLIDVWVKCGGVGVRFGWRVYAVIVVVKQFWP